MIRKSEGMIKKTFHAALTEKNSAPIKPITLRKSVLSFYPSNRQKKTEPSANVSNWFGYKIYDDQINS